MIVIAGTAQNCGHQQFVVARYKTGGTLDAGFGTGGAVNTQIDNASEASAAAIQPSDQKIVVAGYSIAAGGTYWRFALARYTPAGILDTTFGSNGTVSTLIGTGYAQAYAVAIQSDGKIVIAGFSYRNNNNIRVFTVARYTAAGVLDAGFGTSGLFTLAIGAGNSQALALAIEPVSHKIIVAGYSVSGSYQIIAVIRLTAAGAIDGTFNGTGIVTTPLGAANSGAESVALQGDGKIVVAGYASNGSRNEFAVVRYLNDGINDGQLDTTFNSTGSVTTIVGSGYAVARAVAIQNDRKIVAAGYAITGSVSDFALVRYDTNGHLDTSFGTGGMVTTQIGTATFSQAYGLALQSDGKIVAAGYSFDDPDTRFAVARYWQ
jgi:uncharacterized delta-60 repeat protein